MAETDTGAKPKVYNEEFYNTYIKPNREKNREKYNEYMLSQYYKKRGYTKEENEKRKLEKKMNKVIMDFEKIGYNVVFTKIT